MARHTVTSSEIPHLWYHQAQDEAHNSSKTFYFEGKTIYSYGTHFPIASLVENKKGEKAVLFTTDTYSHSTSGHKNAVKAAIPADATIFYLPLYHHYSRQEGFVTEYLAKFARLIKEASAAILTPRIREATRLKHFGEAQHLAEEANRFAIFFGEKPRFKVSESVDALKADMEAYQKREEVRIAREAKAREKKEKARLEQYRKEHAEDLQLWLNGERCKADPYGLTRAFGTAFLRVIHEEDGLDNPAEVETSLGVRVPLAHAKLVLRIVLKARETKIPYQRNGHTIHIGHYALDSIDIEGNVMAGCHNIKWTEIERFANKYGLMPEADVSVA